MVAWGNSGVWMWADSGWGSGKIVDGGMCVVDGSRGWCKEGRRRCTRTKWASFVMVGISVGTMAQSSRRTYS